jgi:hypothetical protein
MKKCPNCSKEIIGRKNKAFCTPYCKSAYHYEKDKNKPLTRFKIIDIQLKLNRKILAKYNQAGKATIRKETLIEAGFNPSSITGWWKNKMGDTYLFCYEFGFLAKKEGNNEKYVLVQWQDYMN